MKKFSKALLFIVFSLLISSIYFNNEKPYVPMVEIAFSELIDDVQKRKIKRIEFNEGHVISIDHKNRHRKTVVNPDAQHLLSQRLLDSNIKTVYNERSFWLEFLIHNFLYIIFLLLFIFSMFFIRLPGLVSKNKFKSRLAKKYSFDDIAGADEAKEELKEVIDFLKNPQKFNDMGAQIPKGILLYGAPGTGKTLLAKAVSCEAGCNFFYASGSEFEEVYVGLGASKLRSLFEEAKKNAPSIIFIDEIETIGGKRSNKNTNIGDQTLNQLLTELDGFGPRQNVILIAATNRLETLDKALLRPGRLGDRIIKINLPSFAQREAIFKVHLKGVKVDPDLNISSLAKITVGLSGADLANIVNEAALLAAKNQDEFVTQQHLKISTEKVGMGPENKTYIMSEEEKRRTAFHESGHAVIAYLCDKLNKIHKISIIPRGEALGYVARIPLEEKDAVTQSKSTLLNHIKVALGGYVAEQIAFGLDEVSSGPTSDLKYATKIARNMVTSFGMSELGLMNYEYDAYDNQISQDGFSQIEKNINKIIDKAYKEVVTLLSTHLNLLNKLAEYLMEKEILNTEEIEDFFAINVSQALLKNLGL